MDRKALTSVSRSEGRLKTFTTAGTTSLAKIASPRIRNVVLRTRLFEVLDSCGDYPVTWLSAPAGSGKTTLVASYIADRKLKSLWYQVDEGDRDQATFFYYMSLAVAQAAPRVKRSMPFLTPAYAFGIPTFTLRYFEELYSRLRPPFVLVLDNYQLVPSESAFHDRVSQGLAIVPEGIRVIVLSRNDPPAQLARLRANEQLHLVETSAIHFTLLESRAFVSMRSPRVIPDEVIGQLHEMTKGWAAGLTLFMESVRTGGLQENLPLFSSDQVFHYFAREIFDFLDKGTQDILMKTAYLPKMTGAMAKALTGTPRAKETLVRLCRDQFFTQKDEQSDPSYQYHPLFREFLLSQARVRFPDGQILTLLRDAAKILEDAGQIEDAADLMLSASDWERLSALFLVHGHSLVGQGRGEVMNTWLDRVPEDVLNASPWFLYWRGLCRILGNLTESKNLLEKAFAMFEACGDHLGAILACGGVVRAMGDDFASLEVWLDRLESLLTHDPPPLSAELDGMLTQDMFGALIWCHPYRSADTNYWLGRGLQVARKTSDTLQELIFLSHAVVYYADHLQFEKALFYSSQGDGLAPRVHSPIAILQWKIAQMARASILGAHGEELVRRVSEMLEFAQQRGIYTVDGYILCRGVVHQFQAGDVAGAAVLLQQLERAAQIERGRVDIYYQALLGWYHFLNGDTSHAARIVKAMPEPSLKWGTWLRLVVFRLQSLMLWAHGDKEEAFRTFSAYRELAAKFDPTSMYSCGCNLCEAYLLLENGEEEKGLEHLTEALAIARAQGYEPNPFSLPPQILASLYATALKHDIEVEYVRKLIEASDLFPENPPFDVRAWPWPIRVNTLGRFEVLIGDKPIEMTRLKKKPLLLLKAIIALGGKGVREETLGEFLWPDAEGDVAYGSFRTTLSRLRSLLCTDEAILLHDGAVSLNPKQVWIDTGAFMRLCAMAETAREEASELAAQVLHLYQGDFLPMEDEYWMVSCREKLRGRFLRVIISLGRELEQGDRRKEAIACYLAAIDTDDLAEEVYQRLMLCYDRLGDRTAALSAYERLCKVLGARFNTPPSSGTKAVYRQIKTGTP